MRSKIITTVVGLTLLTPFSVLGLNDAVSIKRHLQVQHEQAQTLHVEAKKLDTKLAETKQAKQQSQQEVKNLEQQTKDAISERQKLEAQLRAY